MWQAALTHLPLVQSMQISRVPALCLTGKWWRKERLKRDMGSCSKEQKSLPAVLLVASLSCQTFNALHLEKPSGLMGLFLHRVLISYLDNILFGNSTDHTDLICGLQMGTGKVFSRCFLSLKSSAVGWEKIVQEC